MVRNTIDGKVEIFARVNDEDTLDAFIKELGKPFSLGELPAGKAEKIFVHKKGETGYFPAWKDFRRFEIDYGE